MPPERSPGPQPTLTTEGELVVLPRSGRVEKGVDYRYTLYTHCGLNELVDFDGSLWDYSGHGAPDDGSRNPPPGFHNPFDHGTMRLISDDVAEYQSEHGLLVKYRRRDGSKVVQMCM